jgi:hypothetical protein
VGEVHLLPAFEIAEEDLEIAERQLLDEGNFLRTLATPEPIKNWTLTSLKEKLIKIGAMVITHGRSIAFQMAEGAIPRQMFRRVCG